MAGEAWSRRQFLQQILRCGTCLAAAGLVLDKGVWRWVPGSGEAGAARAAGPWDELLRTAPVARYWTSAKTAAAAGVTGAAGCQACHAPEDIAGRDRVEHQEPETIRCLLCAQRCLIPAGRRGKCGVRLNQGGVLRSLSYGRPAAVHLDPIEKKPFYHFLPGRQALSLGTVGCALHCRFCQNWELSQGRPEDRVQRFVPPEDVVQVANDRRAPVIAFTYNEPTVFTEYLVDIARLARQAGIRSVLVSCGYMNEAPLAEMCECLDAIKIDLKGYSPEFYRRVCDAELDPVLRSIKQIGRSGVHQELVNLVVPTLNDSRAMLEDLCRWVADELGPDVPIHFTRFHPDYQLMHLPPTPVATLEQAGELAAKHGLRYAYIGNVPGHRGDHTYCPACGEVVIRRRGFLIEANRLRDGKCEQCGAEIAGVWR